MAHRRVRFGVNYVPSKRWWYSWLDWDSHSIAEDLAAIAALGMDHIRIHCIWPIFQPNPTYISASALAHLEELLDLAQAVGLEVVVAVLDGWLSGFAFRPAWQKGRNMFTDEEMIAGEKRFFAALAERIGSHPGFLGFDLGNELGVLQQIWEPVTQEEADIWLAEMMDFCEQIAPGKFHVNGVDHVHWYRNVGFSRRALATLGHATSLHTWILFTGTLGRYGIQGTGTRHLAEYSIELARAYHQRLDRPIWVQEFGASPEWLPEADIPDFAQETIENALTCDHLWGLTWWCSHDIRREFTGFDVLEYGLGLLDVDNRPKPVGERLASLISRWREDMPRPCTRSTALVWPEHIFRDAMALWRYIDAFMELIEDGVRPAIVLEDRAQDAAYLAARGITSLERLDG